MRNIGDKGYYASFDLRVKHIPCGVCFGNKYVKVILGNGEEVTVECLACEKGYLGPTGYQEIYEYEAKAQEAIINRIEVTGNGVEYYTDCGCGEYRFFDTKEEAIIRCSELAKKHNDEQIERIKHREKPNKDWTWHVYYHKKEMQNAEKSFFYHQEKLDIAKENAKKYPRKNKGAEEAA